MVADFEMAVGRGHASAALSFDRSAPDAGRVSAWPAVAAVALTMPFTIALAVNAVAQYTNWLPAASLHGLFGGPVRWGLLLAFGPPLALLILAAARLRLHVGRRDGRFTVGIRARLERWEVVVGVVALLVAAAFFGHLAADALACANGVTRAC